MWEGWLLRGLLTQSIKAVWDSHWDTKGLRVWAPHKQDSKTVPLRNTNMGPYFLPQQPPTPSTANTSTPALLPQLVDCVLWFDQLCGPAEEIINNSLNSLPLTFHCDSPRATLSVYDNNQQDCVKPSLQDFTPYNCQYGITGLCQRDGRFKDPILVSQTHFTTTSMAT